MIPEINKEYNCYDDGKIRITRHYIVTVTNVIPFNDIDKATLDLWKKEVETCDWLYNPVTDYFIKTVNIDDDEEVFVRTKNDEWFGLGGMLSCGLLDIDGNLTKGLNDEN